MPKNFINVNNSTRWGSNLYSIVNNFCGAVGALEQLKAALDNMTDGVDYTVIEANLGVQTGKGQAIYNLVAGALAEVQGDANLSNLLNWTGGTR